MIVSLVVRYNPEFEEYNGLVFDLGEKTQIIEDDRLDEKKYPSGLKFDEVDDLGLPKFYEEGSKTWYARKNGLSRLLLNRGLNLESCWNVLASSSENGRVVLVRGEATRENFSEENSKYKQILRDINVLYEKWLHQNKKCK